MSPEVIPAQNVTDQTITDILDNAAIEHSDHAGIYVSGTKFNFWISTESERNLLILWSYWDIAPDAEEIDILRFCNAANRTKLMLQFSYSEEMGRFYGYFSQPYHAGFIAQHLLKLIQMFPSIMADVVEEGVDQDLLKPLPQCSRMETAEDQHPTKH